MISEKHIMNLLQEYVRSKKGRAALKEIDKNLAIGSAYGAEDGFYKDQMQKYLDRIKREFTADVQKVIPSFDASRVHARIKNIEKGVAKAVISIENAALRRESLFYTDSSNTIHHGEGVRDILALFTHGYTLKSKNPPSGFWVRDGGNSMTKIVALSHRDSNPFLQNIVDRLSERYKNACTITLDERYRL